MRQPSTMGFPWPRSVRLLPLLLLVAGITIVGPAGATAVAGAPLPDTVRTVRVPTSIDGTGASDVSAVLQAFVDKVPDHSRIEFQPGATYRLSRGLRLDGRRDLVLKGRGATFKGGGCSVEDSLLIVGRGAASARITIQGLSLIGNNARAGTSDAYRPGCEYMMAAAIYRSRAIRLIRVQMRNVNGDCVYIGGAGSPFTWSQDILIRNSICSGPGRMGVAITAGKHIRVESSKFWRVGLFPFDIEPNRARDGAFHVVFSKNNVGRYTLSGLHAAWLFEANGSGEAVVRDVTFQGNVVSGGPLRTKVQRTNRFDFVIRNNTSRVRAVGPVMFFDHTRGVTVKGNDQPLRSGPLASFRSTSDVEYVP